MLHLHGLERVPLHQEVPWPATLLTSMFMHGGWMHIIGNMWFLWIFGDNVEDAMGHVKYLVFYLLCGRRGGGGTGPDVPSSRCRWWAPRARSPACSAPTSCSFRTRACAACGPIIIVTTVYVPAWLLLGLWFVSQFFMPGAGVAWMAHVGGFVIGFLLVRLFVGAGRRRGATASPALAARRPLKE